MDDEGKGKKTMNNLSGFCLVYFVCVFRFVLWKAHISENLFRKKIFQLEAQIKLLFNFLCSVTLPHHLGVKKCLMDKIISGRQLSTDQFQVPHKILIAADDCKSIFNRL